MTNATIFGLSGPRITPSEATFFAQTRPWGFILFARNIENPDQLRALTSELRDAVGYNAPIFIDQEGGRVARMTAPHWREWLPALDEVIRAGARAPDVMAQRYRVISAELRAVGIDGNCAPCADLMRPNTHPVLKNRTYGDDPVTVARIARAVSDAHLAGGVLPVIKHMPGLGHADLDSHVDLPRTDLARSELMPHDFGPFRMLNDLPLGMSTHVVYSDIDADAPATTSHKMISLIRNDIGFDGLLMSDDLNMEALSGTIDERARRARNAGIDIILHCNGDLDQMKAVASASCDLIGDAKRRADNALAARIDPEPVDISELCATFDEMISEL